MFCPNCGNQIDERANYCPHCGRCFNAPPPMPSGYYPPTHAQPKSHWFLKLLMVLSCIFGFLSIIGWIWILPMTIHLFNKIERRERLSTAFKVCTILFVSVLAGIIMACSDDL